MRKLSDMLKGYWGDNEMLKLGLIAASSEYSMSDDTLEGFARITEKDMREIRRNRKGDRESLFYPENGAFKLSDEVFVSYQCRDDIPAFFIDTYGLIDDRCIPLWNFMIFREPEEDESVFGVDDCYPSFISEIKDFADILQYTKGSKEERKKIEKEEKNSNIISFSKRKADREYMESIVKQEDYSEAVQEIAGEFIKKLIKENGLEGRNVNIYKAQEG